MGEEAEDDRRGQSDGHDELVTDPRPHRCHPYFWTTVLEGVDPDRANQFDLTLLTTGGAEGADLGRPRSVCDRYHRKENVPWGMAG